MTNLIQKHSNKFLIGLLFLVNLYGLLFLVNLYKLVLINAGFMTEPDERRYIMTWSFLKHLSQGELATALHAVFSANGRPAAIIVHSIPASLQLISAKLMGWEIFETKNFAVVFGYNFLINLLILYVLFKIYKLIFNHQTIALLGILIFSVLVNNFSYLRHIYPYNESLLLFLWVVYKLLKKYKKQQFISLKTAYIFGAIAFLAYLIYPAHYLSFMAVYLLFNFILTKQYNSANQIIKINFSYILGSFTVLAFFELLSGIGHTSYINNVLYLSETVNQGSFEESFSFIFKYLAEVEKLTGYLLILGMLLFLFYLPKWLQQKKYTNSIIFMLVISFLIPFLLHASLGFFFHKMIFYGRILHQFMFIVILFLLYVLSQLPTPKQQYVGCFIALVISIQFVVQIQTYLKIAYPRDVYWQYLKNYPKDKIIEISEYEDAWSNLPQKMDSIYIRPQKSPVKIVNSFYFYPFNNANKFHPYKASPTEKLIFDKPHFINYKAYQYEGYGIKDRKTIDSLQPHIKIYLPQN